jgi:hypothetical protein
MVKLQEAENQIVTDYEVYDRRPNDADLLIAAVETHHARLGRIPRLVAADAAFYSAKNDAAAKAKGVKRVCIPSARPKVPSADASRKSPKLEADLREIGIWDFGYQYQAVGPSDRTAYIPHHSHCRREEHL